MNNALSQQNIKTGHTKTGRKRAGFSLVEILVVLVVLVVGILAIVRLFPAGFIALRNAQNSTFADRLGQAALESLKQGQGTLPDAVYMYEDAYMYAPGDAYGFNPNVVPDDLYSYLSDGTGRNTSRQYGLLTANFADINKQRFISNETVAVPAAHVVSNVMYPPLYTVAFGPIFLPSAPSMGGGQLPYLTVNSAPWAMQNGDSRLLADGSGRSVTNPADVLSPTQGAYLADLAAYNIASPQPPTAPVLRPTQNLCLVDLGAGQIAVPTASYQQTFTLTVTTKGRGTLLPVTITVPALGIDNSNNPTGYLGSWFKTTDTTATGTALPSLYLADGTTYDPWTSITLTRPFQYMGILPAPGGMSPFTADPYQYCLDSGNIAGGATTENMGVLAFNPIAGGQNGIPPLQAQISYQTLNWHVLHENLDVPSGGGTLKLVLDHLKRVGDVQFDGTIFAGLTTDANTPAASQYDLFMLDRDTGDIYGFRGTGGNIAATEYTNGTATDLTGAYYVDVVDNGDDPSDSTKTGKPHIVLNYAGGRVTFPAMFASKHFRVFYAGDADWAVAVQKAPSTYTQTFNQADLSTISADTPNRYFIPYTTNAGVNVTTGTRIYFPACDAGKTVELDNVTYDATNNNMAVSRSSTGTPQLAQVVFPVSVAPETLGGTNYYVELGRFGPNSQPGADVIVRGSTNITSDTNITNLKFSSARGVSLRAIVIWHERNTWHTRATDTLLTRSQ